MVMVPDDAGLPVVFVGHSLQFSRKIIAAASTGTLFQGKARRFQLVAGLPGQRSDASGQAVRQDLVQALSAVMHIARAAPDT